MKIKVSEAYGVVLDWLVAKCEGGNLELIEDTCQGRHVKFWLNDGNQRYKFSARWEAGGPIVEREITGIDLVSEWKNVKKWSARKFEYLPNDQTRCTEQQGPTLLVAAMRCYVASKLGDYADVPEELPHA